MSVRAWLEVHTLEESPHFSLHLPWAGGYGAPSYQDYGARGCRIKFIMRRVPFRGKYVKPVGIGILGLHGWP